MSLLAIISVLYIGYLHIWEWGPLNPGERVYTQLFKLTIYLTHFLFAIAIGIVGYFYSRVIPSAHWLFAPLLFLLLFKMADWVSFGINNRHFMLTRMNRFNLGGMEEEQKVSDFILDFVISGATLAICVWLHFSLHTQSFL